MRLSHLARLAISAATWLCLGCPGAADGPVGVDAGTLGDAASDGGYKYDTVFATEHADAITGLWQNQDRLLSVDSSNHYNLWNVHAKTSIFNGDTKSPASLGGPLFMVQPADFEVRDVTDGHLLFSIPAATVSSAAVANDGSYVWASSSTSFQVLSPTGTMVFRVNGDYSHAAVFAAPNEVRIANGGKGSSSIELLTVPMGTSTISSAIQGVFQSWFADGSQLLTLSGGVLHSYSKAGAAEGVFPVAASVKSFGGIGDFVWVLDTNPPSSYLNFYPASGSSMPAASFNVTGVASVGQAGSGLAVMYTNTLAVDIITLSAGKLTNTRFTSTVPNPAVFAMDAGGTWSVGSPQGIVHYGDPMNPAASGRLGYGVPLALRGSGAAGTAAIAAVGFSFKTLVFDVGAAPVKQQEVDFGSNKIALSSDGTVLAASGASFFPYFTDLTLKAFALPMGTPLNAWPYTGSAYLLDFQLAAGGTRIARILATSDAHVYERHISDISGMLHVLDDTGSRTLLLSPDGTEYADVLNNYTTISATRIYRNGALVTGIDGAAVGWLDDRRLLVNLNNTTGAPHSFWCNAWAMYDAAGNPLSPPSGGCFNQASFIPPDRLYDERSNIISDLTTSHVDWMGPSWANQWVQTGSLAGDSVLYVYGREIRRVKYR